MVSLENTLIKERYLLIKKIGEGSFGEVYLAIDNIKGNYLAVKCESAQSQHPRILYESSVMQ